MVGLLETRHLLTGFLQNLELLLWNFEVGDSNADTTHRGITEAEVLEVVQECSGTTQSRRRKALEDEVTEFLLTERLIEEAELFRNDGVEQHPSRRAAKPASVPVSLLRTVLRHPVPAGAVELEPTALKSHLHFAERGEPRRIGIDLIELFISLRPGILRRLVVIGDLLEI